MSRVIVSIDGVMLKEVTLAKDRTTLGRRPYNDLVIDNLSVSGEHAVLHRVGSEVYLEDLNSTNGTFVNAQAVTRQALRHNDVVEIGKYKIRFLATPGLPGAVATSALSDSGSFGTGLTAPGSLLGARGESTSPALLGSFATVKVLTGPGTGRDISLQKVVTTIGKPGIAVAAITRRLNGYMVTQVDGPTMLNSVELGPEAVALQNGDVIELAATQMRFDQA